MSKTMNYHNVKFTAAYGTSKQLPLSTRAEVSFVGRSNVGKSSLMNKLFNRKKLAKVSATPGKNVDHQFLRGRMGRLRRPAGLWLRASFEVRKPDGAK